MSLVHERVSFVVRKLATKFRVILSTFEHCKGVVCGLGKLEWDFPKIQFSLILGSLERSRRALQLSLLTCGNLTSLS